MNRLVIWGVSLVLFSGSSAHADFFLSAWNTVAGMTKTEKVEAMQAATDALVTGKNVSSATAATYNADNAAARSRAFAAGVGELNTAVKPIAAAATKVIDAANNETKYIDKMALTNNYQELAAVMAAKEASRAENRKTMSEPLPDSSADLIGAGSTFAGMAASVGEYATNKWNQFMSSGGSWDMTDLAPSTKGEVKNALGTDRVIDHAAPRGSSYVDEKSNAFSSSQDPNYSTRTRSSRNQIANPQQGQSSAGASFIDSLLQSALEGAVQGLIGGVGGGSIASGGCGRGPRVDTPFPTSRCGSSQSSNAAQNRPSATYKCPGGVVSNTYRPGCYFASFDSPGTRPSDSLRGISGR